MDPRPRVVAVALACLVALAAPAGSHAQTESFADRIQFHGYGEFHYNNPQIGTMDEDAIAEADVHRFVLGWTYEFTDALRMDAEIDFEHAATEIELEYAHIDYDLKPTLALRAGAVLMPVGPLNEFHEPPLYYSVERPYVENTIMPTTWQEFGVGLVGRSGALAYRGYVVTGLDASGFSSLSGIRGGRTHAAEAPAEDLAGVARIEYASQNGLQLGASGYYGGADQGDSTLGDVTVGIVNADARFRRSGLDLRGVVYRVFLDAEELSTARGEPIGEAMMGWYAEAAYDLLRRDKEEGRRRSLFVFGRFEDFDTNEDVDETFPADPEASRQVITGGISYLPIEKIAFKADYEHWEDDADQKLNRFNLGAAFMF
jgi:hypothetical protein